MFPNVPPTTWLWTTNVKLATLNAKDVSTTAITALIAPSDTTNWAPAVSRLATPTCLLITLPTSAFSAQIPAKPAAAFLSAPPVLTLKPFP